MSDNPVCGNIGPRIGGEGAPRCALPPHDSGPHVPDESWRHMIESWTDSTPVLTDASQAWMNLRSRLADAVTSVSPTTLADLIIEELGAVNASFLCDQLESEND